MGILKHDWQKLKLNWFANDEHNENDLEKWGNTGNGPKSLTAAW